MFQLNKKKCLTKSREGISKINKQRNNYSNKKIIVQIIVSLFICSKIPEEYFLFILCSQALLCGWFDAAALQQHGREVRVLELEVSFVVELQQGRGEGVHVL